MSSIRQMATDTVDEAFKGKTPPASGTASLVPPTQGLIEAKLIHAAHPDKKLVDVEGAKGAVFEAAASALGPDRKTEAGVVGEAIITGVNSRLKPILGKGLS